jgi:hypothetical protein
MMTFGNIVCEIYKWQKSEVYERMNYLTVVWSGDGGLNDWCVISWIDRGSEWCVISTIGGDWGSEWSVISTISGDRGSDNFLNNWCWCGSSWSLVDDSVESIDWIGCVIDSAERSISFNE